MYKSEGAPSERTEPPYFVLWKFFVPRFPIFDKMLYLCTINITKKY